MVGSNQHNGQKLSSRSSLLVFIPSMTSSDFKIVPCELSDMSECVDIFDEAFATDPAVLYLYPHCDPKVLKDKSLKGYEKSYTAPGTKYFKAVNKETGSVFHSLLPRLLPREKRIELRIFNVVI
jgi:hypothetical protein